MSSLPGVDLEDYVMWVNRVLVAGRGDSNPSLQLADALRGYSDRPTLDEEAFQRCLALYEPYRKQIEWLLGEFDEEHQSWRDYSYYAFPDDVHEVNEKAMAIVLSISGENS